MPIRCRWCDCPTALLYCKPYIVAVINKGLEVKTIQLVDPIQVRSYRSGGGPVIMGTQVRDFNLVKTLQSNEHFKNICIYI